MGCEKLLPVRYAHFRKVGPGATYKARAFGAGPSKRVKSSAQTLTVDLYRATCVQVSDQKAQLTQRQAQALEFIRGCLQERGFPPTLREIGEHMGIRSTNGVNDHLKALERKGYLVREGLKSRALRPVDMPAGGGPKIKTSDFLELPVIGRVAAGAPILAEENVVDRLRIDPSMVSAGSSELFALLVQGESMIEAGILHGDYVFVRKCSTARAGEMVVVMIDGEATCKFFFRDKDAIRLEPANQNMGPIIVHETEARTVEVVGKVVGVYRRMN